MLFCRYILVMKRKHADVIYRFLFSCKNFQKIFSDIFLIFAQNIDCGYTLEQYCLLETSTHSPCFGAKIRKIGYPCIPQFCYIKVGFKGVFIAWTCFTDDETSFSFFQVDTKSSDILLILTF